MRTSRAGALRLGASILRAAGIERPRLEARLLLGCALRLDQEVLLRDTQAAVDMALYQPLLARREAHEPLALITGRQEFWSLPFAVSPATLIPRADTETLLEAALALFPERGRVASVLDLGTGTGCLLLAALTEFPAAFGVGVDLAPDAARLAAGNAATLGLSGRAAFLAGDWGAPLGGRFDLILSNPPYIETSAIPTLIPEVRRYEPPGCARWRAGRARSLSPDHSRPAGPVDPERVGRTGSGAGAGSVRGRHGGTRRAHLGNASGSRGHFPGGRPSTSPDREKTVWHDGNGELAFFRQGRSQVGGSPAPWPTRSICPLLGMTERSGARQHQRRWDEP